MVSAALSNDSALCLKLLLDRRLDSSQVLFLVDEFAVVHKELLYRLSSSMGARTGHVHSY